MLEQRPIFQGFQTKRPSRHSSAVRYVDGDDLYELPLLPRARDDPATSFPTLRGMHVPLHYLPGFLQP